MLAPMAGITDSPFRRMAKAGGAGLVFTEMLSASALARDSRRTTGMLKFTDEERPIAAQIFGSELAAVEESAAIITEMGYDMLNINFGCPARKILKSRGGAAALKDLKSYEDVISASVRGCGGKIPVTVKIRPGLTPEEDRTEDFVRTAEAAGAEMIIIHGRFVSQIHSGDVSFDAIARAVTSVKIPVVANGGIISEETAGKMLAETGCAGLMLGRGAIGDFDIFRRILYYLENKEILLSPSREERIAKYKEHARLSAEFHGERCGVIILRKLAAFYLKGLPGAKRTREAINKAENLNDFCAALDGIFEPTISM
jgi:tRNA-dihydrouridine synthase B